MADRRPITKARFEMSPEEWRIATANDIDLVAREPHPRSPAYYRYLKMLRDEGPLPEGVREGIGYKNLAYFDSRNHNRDASPRAALVRELDDWAAANG